MSKKQTDREMKLVLELQDKHGYLLSRVKRESDRYVSTFKREPSGKMSFATKYVVQFAIPVDSALGKAMIESEKKLGNRVDRKAARR